MLIMQGSLALGHPRGVPEHARAGTAKRKRRCAPPRKRASPPALTARRFDQGLSGRLDFVSDRFADHGLEACASDVFAQCVVNERLIVAPPSPIYRGLNMLDSVVVEPNRDSCLAGSRRHDRTSTGLAEIVLSFHLCLLSYCDSSR